jgi:hypothetical protein
VCADHEAPVRFYEEDVTIESYPSAALAYIQLDGAFRPMCLSTLSLDANGKIDHIVVFVLPRYFAQWGFPATL